MKETLRQEIINLTTPEQVHEVFDLCRKVARQIEAKEAMKFSPGDRVKWASRHTGDTSGIVTDVNTKTLSVKSDNGTRYRVSPTLLTKVTA